MIILNMSVCRKGPVASDFPCDGRRGGGVGVSHPGVLAVPNPSLTLRSYFHTSPPPAPPGSDHFTSQTAPQTTGGGVGLRRGERLSPCDSAKLHYCHRHRGTHKNQCGHVLSRF